MFSVYCKNLNLFRFLKIKILIFFIIKTGLLISLNSQAESLKTSAEKEAWKQQLHVHHISLVYASSYLTNPASAFGHLFLRLHTQNQSDWLDYGVNYAAATGSDSGAQFALYGLLGLYKAYYNMKPYHELIRDYHDLEGRDLYDYELNLNSTEINLILDYLLEFESHGEDYYFLNSNCASQILHLLSLVKPELKNYQSFVYTMPTDVIRYIHQNSNLLKSPTLKLSSQSQIQMKFDKLSLESKIQLQNLISSLDSKSQNISNEISLKMHSYLANDNISASEKNLFLEILSEFIDRKTQKLESQGVKSKEFDKISFQIKREQAHFVRTYLETQKSNPDVLIQSKTPVELNSSEIQGPEKGHDSQSINFSVLQSSNDFKQFFQLGYSPAMHSRWQSPISYVPNSELEILKFNLQYTDSNLYLSHLSLFQVLSAPMYTKIYPKLSWRSQMQYNKYPDAKIEAFEFGLGQTFKVFSKITWISLLQDRISRLDSTDISFTNHIGYWTSLNFLIDHNWNFEIQDFVFYLSNFKSSNQMDHELNIRANYFSSQNTVIYLNYQFQKWYQGLSIGAQVAF